MAFLGALEMINLSEFNTFAGVSAGSIVALCLCLGYSVDEALHTLKEADLTNALAESISPLELFSGFPFLDQSAISSNVAKWMRRKGVAVDSSFEQLLSVTGRSLRVVACSADQKPKLKVFDAQTTPHVQVLRAVLASTAVPLAFSPTYIEGIPYSDAGVINNLSMFCCPPSKTLVLLSGDDQGFTTSGLFPSGLTLLAEMALERMDFLVQCELKVFQDVAIVVKMPRLPSSSFHLFRLGNGSDDDLKYVIQQGRDAMKAFISAPQLLCFICLLLAQGDFLRKV